MLCKRWMPFYEQPALSAETPKPRQTKEDKERQRNELKEIYQVYGYKCIVFLFIYCLLSECYQKLKSYGKISELV